MRRGIEASITGLVAGSIQATVLVIGLLCAGHRRHRHHRDGGRRRPDRSGLSLALKEVLTNVLSGIMVVAYKPFHEGDVISVATAIPTALEGTVREINLRFTRLEAEGRRIYVPNSLILSNAVVVREQAAVGPPQGLPQK